MSYKSFKQILKKNASYNLLIVDVQPAKVIHYTDKGNSSTTPQVLSFVYGQHQRIKATGDFSLSVSNWPTTGILGEMLVELVADGTLRTINYGTVNWINTDGSFVATPALAGITMQSVDNSIDWILLWSRDGGTTVYGKVMR
jgi:hypothetical protein